MKQTLMSKKVWLTALITVASIYLAVRNISWTDVGRSLSSMDPVWLVPSLLLILLSLWVRGIKWAVLFNEDSPFSTAELSRTVTIGYMFNNIFPARLGEFVRVYLLSRGKRSSRMYIFSTIFTERVYDVVSLVIALFFFFMYVRFIGVQNAGISGMMTKAGQLMIVILPLSLIGLAVIIFWPHRLEALITWLAGLMPKHSRNRADSISGAFMAGLAGFRKPRMAGLTVGWALVSWVLFSLSHFCLIRGFAFSRGLAVDMAMAVATIIAVNLAMVLPATPGYVGIWEAAMVAALTLFGVGKSEALAFGFLSHVVNVVPVNLLGWYFLVKDHIGIRELAASASSEEKEMESGE